MADQTISTKLCTVCGVDCAGKPRIKDQQGRYICKECFDKAKETRQTQKNPPAPVSAVAPSAVTAIPAEGDNSFLLDMGSKESTGIAGTKACPECGRALPSSAVICIGCGYNLSTGKRLSVKVVKTKQKAEKSSGGSDGRTTAIPPAVVGLAILVVYGGLIAMSYFNKDLALPALLISALISLTITIWVSVHAFQEGVGTGLLFLFIPFYALYWVTSRCENDTLKWAWCSMALCSVALRVINSGLIGP